MKPSTSQKSKQSIITKKKNLHQNNTINEEASRLLNCESDGSLTTEDIAKFKFLIARDPIIKPRV